MRSLRFLLTLSVLFFSVSAVAEDTEGPPPAYFAKASGVVMNTIASTVPATLTTGTLGKCKRFVSSLDGTVVNTCDVTGAVIRIGDTQSIEITKTQVIEAKKSLETGKPYVVYWFIGKTAIPAGAAARLVVTQHEGQTRLSGDVSLSDYGSKSPLFLDVTR